MNSIDKLESFGIKEVPDVYFCDEEGNILYFTQLVKHIKFSQIKRKAYGAEWKCRFTCPLGNLENWFKIPTDINIKTIYFRTVKRSAKTGEDIPFAVAINNPQFSDFEFELGADLDNFNFPISFHFTIAQLAIINDEKNLPNVIKEFDKEKRDT